MHWRQRSDGRLLPATPTDATGEAMGGGSAAMSAVPKPKEATMPKFTDTQLVILSAAAQSEDGAALPLPKSLKIKGDAITKTLEGLRKKGLLEEKSTPRKNTAWREGMDGRLITLSITEAGLRALGTEPGPGTGKGLAATKASSDAPPEGVTGKGADPNSKPETTPSGNRPGTKQSLLIELLSRKAGATIPEIAEATGWQTHSVRGAISGTLKKKHGFPIASEKVDGRGRVYRIVAGG
jgi:predicted ArsR family transcriptional regulator